MAGLYARGLTGNSIKKCDSPLMLLVHGET